MVKVLADVHGVRHIVVHEFKNAWNQAACGAAVRRPQGMRRLRSGMVTCLQCMEVHKRQTAEWQKVEDWFKWYGFSEKYGSRTKVITVDRAIRKISTSLQLPIEYLDPKTTKRKPTE